MKNGDDAVCKAYPLSKYIIETNSLEIKLFSFIKKPCFFTNAPYLEEGGLSLKQEKEDLSTKEIFSLLHKYRAKYILLKSRQPILFENSSKMEIDKGYYTFLLDTTADIQSIWENKLRSKTRNQIRKAEKHDFNIKFGHIELLDDFYTVISRCWRDLGTPVHSYMFYKVLLENFGNRVTIVGIFDQGLPVSVALLFNINGNLSHPFAGTIKTYKPTSVNNLLYWNIIKYACENNIHTFDMGRKPKRPRNL